MQLDLSDVDEKDRQTFLELQKKIIDAHGRMKALAHQQRMKERSMQEAVLVSEQIKPLPDDAKTYRAVGRAYFLARKDDVMTALTTEADQCKEEISQSKTGQELVDRELKESENNLKELLQSSPALAAKLKPS